MSAIPEMLTTSILILSNYLKLCHPASRAASAGKLHLMTGITESGSFVEDVKLY